MRIAVISYAVIVLLQFPNTESISNTNNLVAKQDLQYIVLSLKSSFQDRYIVAEHANSIIKISVNDIYLGTGYIGVVKSCERDFVAIYDSNKNITSGLKCCGSIIPDEWKNWESTSNNVSIVYHQTTRDQFGFRINIQYEEILYRQYHRHHARAEIETLSMYNTKSKHAKKNVHLITTDDKSVIFVNISVNNGNVGSLRVDGISGIKIFDSRDERDAKYITISELFKLGGSYLWQSHSNNVSVECDHLSEHQLIEVKYFGKLKIQSQRYEASTETEQLPIYSNKSRHALKNNYFIGAKENYILFFSVSLEPDHIKTGIDSQTVVKIYDSRSKEDVFIVTLQLLYIEPVSWQSISNDVTVECEHLPEDQSLQIEYKEIESTVYFHHRAKITEEKLPVYRESPIAIHIITTNRNSLIVIKVLINSALRIARMDNLNLTIIKIYDSNNEEDAAFVEMKDLHVDVPKFWESSSDNVTIEISHPPRDHSLQVYYSNVPCMNGYIREERCICHEGYEGVSCSEISGSHCEKENYTVPFTQNIFQWEATRVGTTNTVSCPEQYTGNATRKCRESTLHGGMWEKPDFTGCISHEIQLIADKTSRLLDQKFVDLDVISNLTARLKMATSDTTNVPLYPGDLSTATQTVDDLARIVKITNAESEDLSLIAKGYGEAVGNIVDPTLVDVWTFTSKEFVQSNMLSILRSMEDLSANVAKKKVEHIHRRRREISKYTANETIHVTTRNLEFHISFHERMAICEDSSRIELGDEISNAVTLTSSVFKIAVEKTPDRYIQVYTARFDSISDFLDTTSVEKVSTMKERSRPFINSEILSSKILNIPTEDFHQFTKPVVIMLELKNKSSIPDLKTKCVFLNMSAVDHNIWTNAGCEVDEKLSNNTHVACKCTHLTNFAVLMDVFDVQENIDHTDYTILTYISYIGGVMSTLACVITVIVFQCFSLRKERVLIHQQLAISIILVQVFFLIGIDRTENQYVCVVMASLLHYSLVAMFCWMLIEGFHLYVMLVKVFRRKPNFKKYLLFGWGLPLLNIGISAGVYPDEYGGKDRCWLSREILLYTFVPVVSLLILNNTIILIIVLRIMMKSMLSRANSEKRSAVKAGLKAAAILLPLLGITWTFGFLSINERETLVFTYLFTICNSLQGVFFFVFHCLLNTDVKSAFERRSQRRSMIKLLTESLNQDMKNRKTSTLNSALTSKSSINSLLTAKTRIEKKKCPKITNNDMDRIHRDHLTSIFDRNYHFNIQRSFSDGITRWQAAGKDFLFYKGKEDVNILKAPLQDTNEKYHENGHHMLSRQNPKSSENHPGDFRIEDLYTKPVINRSMSVEKSENNHVRFEGTDEKENQENLGGELKETLIQELKDRLQ